MSLLELERKMCSGCNEAATGALAEFNHSLLCADCFRQKLTSYVEQIAA
jgi:hypothetical protein